MKRLLGALVLAGAVSTPVLACNQDQLNGDIGFCKNNAQAGALGKMTAGARDKNARLLNQGFMECQSGSEQGGARSNWKNCEAGVQIDHTRHILGIN